ncbi:hypothetical protein C8R46DRAFT_1041092 [Mycena filopes]|nr:hypothetical protein C8R46DRAFT_1041092 [Mycena filopes]
MLLTLSPELVQEIVSWLAAAEQRNVRLTCEDISAATQPLFFSSLTLQVGGLRRNIEILEAIASGKTGWARWAKTLKHVPQVDPSVGGGDAQSERVFRELSGSLSNVCIVIWKTDAQHDPEWAQDVIPHFLSTLPTLYDLRIEIDIRPEVRLPVISGRLIRLSVTSPPLVPPPELVPWIWETILQNRKTLVGLHLMGSGREIFARLASTVGTDGVIRLEELTTSGGVASGLLTYLASYSGLRRLKLRYSGGANLIESDRFADIFFETVLPQHVDSLVELSLSPGFEGRWSFGAHNVDILSRLRNLTHLEITLNAADVINVAPEGNAVTRLLRLTTHCLRRLQTLALLPANSERNRGARCGRPWAGYSNFVKKNIRGAVESFRTAETIATVNLLRVGYTWYRLVLSSAAAEARELAYCEFAHPERSWQTLRKFDREA